MLSKRPVLSVFFPSCSTIESRCATRGTHHSFDDHPPLDVVVIPGGNTTQEMRNPATIAWLEKVMRQTRINTSVCTGAFLPGKVGLLDGHTVTTHWSMLDQLAKSFPHARVQRDVRWVDEDVLVTAAGISAGLDMSLHLVERLLGREVAERTAHYLEYTRDEKA